MAYLLQTDEKYEKKTAKLLQSSPEICKAYFKTLELLAENPKHPSLRLHKLEGDLKGYYSVSINLKYRITIDFIIKDNLIILLEVTKHYQ